MKKLITLILCAMMLLCLPSCGKKEADPVEQQKKQTPAVSVDDIVEPDEDQDSGYKKEAVPEDTVDDTDEEYSREENEEYVDADTNETDSRSEMERVEIQNNIRDIKELIETGDYEDAMMILEALKTRKLSQEENEELIELEKQLSAVVDSE